MKQFLFYFLHNFDGLTFIVITGASFLTSLFFPSVFKRFFKHIEDGVINEKMVFVICFFLAVLLLHYQHDWAGDFSEYLAQSRAIINGNINDWFKDSSWIISHSFSGLGPIAYPWMTAILFSPIYAFFGLNTIPYKILEMFFLFGSVFVYLQLLRRRFNNTTCLIIICFIAFNPNYLSATNFILSDLPGCFFCMLSILFIDKYINERTLCNAVLVGIALAISYEIRTASAALIVALFIDDFLLVISKIKQKRVFIKKLIYLSIPYIVFLFIYIVFFFIFPEGTSTYKSFFTLDTNIIIENVFRHIQLFGELLFGTIRFSGTFLFKGISILFAICIFLGIFSSFGKERYLAFYFLISVITLLLFDGSQGVRYLFAIFPIALIFANYGIQFISKYLSLKIIDIRNGFATMIIVLLFFLSLLKGTVSHIQKSYYYGPYTTESQDMFAYISDNLKKTDVVYFAKPRVLYLFTGCMSYFVEDQESDLKFADYILTGDGNWSYNLRNLKGTIEDSKGLYTYKLIYENDDLHLYQIIK